MQQLQRCSQSQVRHAGLCGSCAVTACTCTAFEVCHLVCSCRFCWCSPVTASDLYTCTVRLMSYPHACLSNAWSSCSAIIVLRLSIWAAKLLLMADSALCLMCFACLGYRAVALIVNMLPHCGHHMVCKSVEYDAPFSTPSKHTTACSCQGPAYFCM